MVAGIMAQSHVNDIDTPGNCLKYSVHGNQVEFHCENDILVSLKICNQSVIRLWYDKGTFSRNNQSFAVETDDLTDVDTVVVSELPQSYEIFTSDLIIRVNKNPFRIRFYDKYQKLLLDDFSDRGYVKDSTGQWAFKTLRNDEHFFGLGEKSGSLDRRGKVFRMWNSDKPCYGVNEDPLYKSIPFFMSNYGYGVFFDNTCKSEFDFGAQSDKYFSFGSPGGEMIWYFIFGPTYKQIIKQYTMLTGKPILPPEWALGFSQCRGLLTNEELTRDIAVGFRERQIPCDIIYQDIGWTQHLQDFNWRKENYKDPQKMLNDLSEQGFKVIVSQDPVISQNNLRQWSEADSLGFFTKDIRTGKSYDMPWPWGGNCGVVDFTNPDVANWWGSYQQRAIDDGVRGFWTDMGEPAWSNEESSDRLFMKHHLGMHAEIHNVFGLTWDKVVTEQFEQHNPNKRVFQMTRAAFAGMQRYTFGWSGDSGDGNDVLNGWEKLAGQIPLALSAGMGLIPFWTTDISGYCGDIKDHEAMAELYIRWMQFGVFNPLSRAHHEGNNAAEPWVFGPDAERICRDAINLKYRLHPYIYTYARNAWDTGLPLMRALLLEYPADAEVLKADGEFLFGKELLVAPVVEKESSSKQIYLPQGEWIDYNNGKTVYQGRQWIAYDTPLNVIPIFVRKGSVLPTMPLMQYIGEKKNYPVIFDVFPASAGRSATFELYEDDGESNDYKRDICRITNVKCASGTLLFNISIEHVDQNGFNQIQVRNNGLRVHLEVCPASVMLNGEKIKKINPRQVEENWFEISSKACWYWDELNGTCVVKFTENKLKDEITINK
ncbi:MAG: DUF4968 domain-containing protein [Lentimicrobiaceae bacterium]|nr:DUF4968 domain-containing protein [Lentimicrobiaceae bacterium]